MRASSGYAPGPISNCSRASAVLAGPPGATRLDKFEPEYDAQDDFAKSLEEGYRVIRERVAAGGPKWVPK